MNLWTFLYFWIGTQSLQIAFGFAALLQKRDASGRKRLGSLVVSAGASILPLFTLLLFLRVFVIGRSSNVAQLAGEAGYELWRLWFAAWPLLVFGNLAAFVVVLVAAIVPPYSPAHWKSIASRVCAIVAAGFACHAVFTYFPDA